MIFSQMWAGLFCCSVTSHHISASGTNWIDFILILLHCSSSYESNMLTSSYWCHFAGVTPVHSDKCLPDPKSSSQKSSDISAFKTICDFLLEIGSSAIREFWYTRVSIWFSIVAHSTGAIRSDIPSCNCWHQKSQLII